MKKIVTEQEEVLSTKTPKSSVASKASKTTSRVASTKESEAKTTTRRRRTTTTRTSAASNSAQPEKNPFTFSLDTAHSLLEMTANDDIYEVYVTDDEYVLFLGKNSSYFSSAQDNLCLKSKSAEIAISKVDGIFRVSTNLDVEISDDVAITNFGKSRDIISFSTADCFKISSTSSFLSITAEVYNKNKFLTNLSVPNASNNCLIISDEDQKVYLPYSFEEVDKRFNAYSNKYDSITDLIEKEYIKPAAFYKNPFTARFREAYKLMRRREHSSMGAALALGIELAFETHLHPAIITACRNLEELDIYLDCLDDNELDKFSCFDIIYKSVPVVLAAQNKAEF